MVTLYASEYFSHFGTVLATRSGVRNTSLSLARPSTARYTIPVNRPQKIAVGITFGLPLVCCLGVFVTIGSAVSRASGTLEGDIAALKKEGFPTEPSDLKNRHPDIDSAQDAAPIYRQIAKLTTNKKEERLLNLVGKGLGRKATAADRAEAEKALAQLGPVIQLIEQAADRKGCNFKRDWSQGFSLLFPEYAQMRYYTRTLAFKAERQSERGDWQGALVSIRRAQQIGRHASEDPVLIASLVNIACEAISVASFRKIIDRHDDNAAFLQASRKLHAGFGVLPDFRFTLGGEFVMGRQALRGIKSWKELRMDQGEAREGTFDRLTIGPLRGAFEAKFVEEYRILAPMLPRDPNNWADANAAMKALDKRVQANDSPLNLVNKIILPTFAQAAQAVGKMQAERRVTETSLRLLQARLTGPLPRTLPTDPNVSIDPFTNAPLKYVRKGRGFTVYSVGQDGVDDGGAARSTTTKNFDLAATFH